MLKWVAPVRRGVGQVTFMDFDGDGNIDILFPVCWPEDSCDIDNAIEIFYNIVRLLSILLCSDSCSLSLS